MRFMDCAMPAVQSGLNVGLDSYVVAIADVVARSVPHLASALDCWLLPFLPQHARQFEPCFMYSCSSKLSLSLSSRPIFQLAN